MGAVYGIFGGAEASELEAMGTRLAHRGDESAEWSPAAGLWLGVRGSAAAGGCASATAPSCFDGSIDNREELAAALGHRPGQAEPAGTARSRASSGTGSVRRAWRGSRASSRSPCGTRPGRRLILARDRVGYAPLYFAMAGERLLFASEYKALLAVDDIPARANRAALQTIQNTKWVRPGVTCVEGIHPVAPGAWIEVQDGPRVEPPLLGHPGARRRPRRSGACRAAARELPRRRCGSRPRPTTDRCLAERRASTPPSSPPACGPSRARARCTPSPRATARTTRSW